MSSVGIAGYTVERDAGEPAPTGNAKEDLMIARNYTATIVVDQSAEVAIAAIQNLRGWWGTDADGESANVGDEYVHRFKDAHRCVLKLIERVPNRKVVWQVVDNFFSFTKDKTEWTGTTLEFELSRRDGRTQVRFTHRGLVPQYECFDLCSNAWDGLIKDNLRTLIMTGKGVAASARD
jgi:hypothetical protein